MASAQQQVLRNVTLEGLGNDLSVGEESEEEKARIIAANSYHWVDLPLDSSGADNRVGQIMIMYMFFAAVEFRVHK